jgi:hypothetical protein
VFEFGVEGGLDGLLEGDGGFEFAEFPLEFLLLVAVLLLGGL